MKKLIIQAFHYRKDFLSCPNGQSSVLFAETYILLLAISVCRCILFGLKLFCCNSRTKTTQLKYFYIEKELSMAKKMTTILLVVTVSLGLAFVAGCESDAQTGALIGAGVGALAGQAIGGDTEGTLIGAGVGAGGGYIIGNEQDKKK